jgi:penicillin amidase
VARSNQLRLCVVAALAITFAVLPGSSLARGTGLTASRLPGLVAPARVVRDALGVPHVYAKSDRDAYFMVGWVHAQDRLFQMDSTRRQASGTLAELLGPSAVASDVQLRTLGLRRAAQLSLDALSPSARTVLKAYAAGVNAYVRSHALPPEYAALELTKFAPWTELDTASVTKLLAFGLSFDVGDIANTQKLVAYQRALGAAAGTALFFQDVMRSEPFARAPTIENGERSGPLRGATRAFSASFLDRRALAAHAPALLRRAAAAGIATAAVTDTGSNIWAVSAAKSATGRALVANDPHLALGAPSTFYEVGIDVSGPRAMKLYGVTFPGAPVVVQGMNEHVAWGSTVNPTDVTDVYQEQVVMSGLVPGATIFKGAQEPTQVIFQEYKANQVGNGTKDDLAAVPPSADVPPVTVIVPRHGPIVSLTPPTALSVQFTGFYATREPDYFLELAHARGVADAKRALRWFDFGAQNWMFADDAGNIAYYTNREVPLREDLQAGKVTGLPPYFIRDGTGGNEWVAQASRPADQAIPFSVLPDAELEQLVNPARGWMSNANQDPAGNTWDNDPLNELRPGGGIRYLAPGYADGDRNWRIRERIRRALDGDGKVSFAEMQAIQSDVVLHDAEVLAPAVVDAVQAARTPGAPAELAALGADARLQDAAAWLGRWDYSAPTGIAEGYDWRDVNGKRAAPTQAEVDASIATTVYSLWRGQALALIVDAPLAARGLGGQLPNGDQAMVALRHLVSTPNGGTSGIFVKDDAAADVLVLTALRNALDLAASPAFAPAFGGSRNVADLRWGKLHRITFRHPLGAAFSLPSAGGFADLAPTLPGLATDGGFSAVDASSHDPRAKTLNGFMFSSGPARRFVAEARKGGPRAVQVIPGGESGTPGARYFGNQLGLWLTDDYHPATVGPVKASARQEFVPAR